MTRLEIDVAGNAQRQVSPEVATVDFAAVVRGQVRERVHAEAVTLCGTMTEHLGELSAAGTVGEWSNSTIAVHREDHRDSDHRYVTRIRLSATFVDVDALAGFLDRWAIVDGVEIGGVHWGLRDATRRRVEDELRAEALADARVKASAYAAALGVESIVPVRIAEPGTGGGAPMMMRAAAAPGLDLHPEDIAVGVTVEARFVADG